MFDDEQFLRIPNPTSSFDDFCDVLYPLQWNMRQLRDELDRWRPRGWGSTDLSERYTINYEFSLGALRDAGPETLLTHLRQYLEKQILSLTTNDK